MVRATGGATPIMSNASMTSRGASEKAPATQSQLARGYRHLLSANRDAKGVSESPGWKPSVPRVERRPKGTLPVRLYPRGRMVRAINAGR